MPFELTEADFISLPPETQEDVLEEWITLSRELRLLTHEVLNTRSHSESGPSAELAVERVGKALVESRRALIATKTGEAILRALAEHRGSTD